MREREAMGLIYRFGSFELDSAARELRKRGLRLKLQDQPLIILLCLVERAGKLVTREQIQHQLWPPGTYVDCENAINSAVWKLRTSLGDTSGNPRFIETLARKGYRFIGKVETENHSSGNGPARRNGVAPEETRTTDSPDGSLGGRASYSVLEPHQAACAASKESTATRIIVLPFRTVDGDGETQFLAYSLPEAISGSLLGIDSLIVRSTALGLRKTGTFADYGVDVVVTGSLLRSDDQLNLTCQLFEAPGGRLISSATFHAPLRNLFQLHKAVSTQVVQSLQLSLSKREHHGLGRDIPATGKAYEAYLQANQFALSRNLDHMRTARDLCMRCLEEDSAYAPAWTLLGRVCRFLWKFCEETPETADCAREAFRRAFSLNPDLAMAHNLYTSIECDEGGSFAAMQRLLGRARFRSHDADLFAGLVQACRYCDELDASVAAYNRAVQLRPDIVTSVPMTYFVRSEYQRTLDAIGSTPGYYLDCAALAALKANDLAVSMLQQREQAGTAKGAVRAIMRSLQALLEGNSADCVKHIEDGKILTRRDPEALYFSARHLAYIGEHERAIAILFEAMDAGFLFASSLPRDPWLKPLSQSRGYSELLQKAQRNRRVTHTGFVNAGGEHI